MIQINDKKYMLTYLIGFILLATFLFSCNTHNHPKAQIILSILTVIGGIICIRYSIKNKDALHKTAFLIIIIFGLLTVFASPLLVAPDEVEHFARSDLTSEGGLIPNYHENQGYFINNYFYQMTCSQGSTLLDNTSFMHQDITHGKTFFTSVFSQNLFYVYLAQGFGIFIAKMLELPVIFALWLGRLCNLLLYSGIVYFAIKKTPAFKKELLVLSCLPIAVFQAASMSSDGIIFALAILNISYFIQMYKSEIIPNKNIIIYLATGVLIGLIKFPYIFLLLMLFLIPANKFKTKKIAIISKMTALLLIVVAGAYSNFYASKELLKGGRIDYYIQNNVNPANQINYIIHNPASAVITFVKSLIFLPYLIFIKDCSFFHLILFPGLDIYNALCLIFFIVFLFLSEDLKMAKRKKLELIILFLIIYTSIFFIQYLSWTPVGYDGILGVGARYFIPILAILPLVFGHKSNSEKLTKYFIVFTTIFLSGMLLIIIAGFY